MSNYRQPISSNYEPEGIASSLSYIAIDGSLQYLPLIQSNKFDFATPDQLQLSFQVPPSGAGWPSPWQVWDISNIIGARFIDVVAGSGVIQANPVDAINTPAWAAMLQPFPRVAPGKPPFDITKSHLWVINSRVGMYQNQPSSDANQLVALLLADQNLLSPIDADFISAGLNKNAPQIALWSDHSTVSQQEIVAIGNSSSVYVQMFCAWYPAGTLLVSATVSIDGKGFTYANADGSNFVYSLKNPPTNIGVGATLEGGASGLGNSIGRMDYLYIWGGEATLGLEVPGFMRFTPEGGKLYV